MANSIASLCQAAVDRCEQAKQLTGDERKLYLHDAINKLVAALHLYNEIAAKQVWSRKIGSENGAK